MLWEWAGLGFVFFLTRQLIRSPLETRMLMVLMFALAVVLAGYGFYQVFVGLPGDRAAYAKNPDELLRTMGQWLPPGSPERIRFEHRLASTEPLATFALANSLAGFLAVWLIMALGACWSRTDARQRRTRLELRGPLDSRDHVGPRGGSDRVRSGRGRMLGAHQESKRVRGRGHWRVVVARVVRRSPLALELEACRRRGGCFAIAGHWRRGCQRARRRGVDRGLEVARLSHAILAVLDRDDSDVSRLGRRAGQFSGFLHAIQIARSERRSSRSPQFSARDLGHGRNAGAGRTAGRAGAVCMVHMARARRASSTVSSGVALPGDLTDSADSARAANFMLAGGPAGLVLAFLVGPLVGFGFSEEKVAVGLLVGAAVVALAWPWVIHGNLPRRLPALGVLVLAIHLLAAGGIEYPGLAQTFWILVAVGMNQMDSQSLPARHDDKPWRIPLAPTAGLALCCVAVGACYISAYRPVLEFHAAMANVEDAASKDVAARIAALRVAGAADPMAAEPWAAFAELELERVKLDPSSAEAHREFLLAAERVLKLRPHSSAAWRRVGQWYRDLYQVNRDSGAAATAALCFRRAVELYPNSAIVNAECALALQVIGERSDAQAKCRTGPAIGLGNAACGQEVARRIAAANARLVRGVALTLSAAGIYNSSSQAMGPPWRALGFFDSRVEAV